MNDCRRLFVAALLLVPSWPAQVRGQTDDPVPASEVIGVLVQFLAGDFGDLEFVGDLRLQGLSQNPCFVTLRFGEGGGQLPSVPLLANGTPVEDGALTMLVSSFETLQITTGEPGQLFRGAVLAHPASSFAGLSLLIRMITAVQASFLFRAVTRYEALRPRLRVSMTGLSRLLRFGQAAFSPRGNVFPDLFSVSRRAASRSWAGSLSLGCLRLVPG